MNKTNALLKEILQRLMPARGPVQGGTFVEATNYIRDIAGREIAIYSGNTLQQWNMYGLDNVGNIKANGDKLYYLKDHLGTVRVVMDTTNTIVAGYDGACPALLPAVGR